MASGESEVDSSTRDGTPAADLPTVMSSAIVTQMRPTRLRHVVVLDRE
jgi:hypothetical protein